MSRGAELFFDILILAALAGTIYYSFRLSRQFNDLRADKKAFEQLISALNVAASRAEGAVRGLKEAAKGSADQLQEKINGARALADELDIMIQAGDSLAERLTSTAEKSRAAVLPGSGESGSPPRTRAERDLLEALKAKQKP